MKVCVYAICKNEEKFIKRWYQSIKDADYICVLDTGSSDNSVSLLKKLGIHVKEEIINPFRFDMARNKALSMIPDDIDVCISLDLDEVIKPNWKEELNRIYKPEINRVRYLYNWSLDEFDKPIVSFYCDKIHSRNNYKWINPVHEILKYEKDNEVYVNSNIVINHYPDSSKSRESYLGLLELSIKEDPENDRNMHYLGREYMYYKRWDHAINTLIKHLHLKSATWKDERCASMRFIARCYKNLNRFDEAYMWCDKAIKETPNLRDPYMEKAVIADCLKDYNTVIDCCLNALKIKEKNLYYINEYFNNDVFIYDLLSIAYYYKDDYKESLKYIDLAIKEDPNNQRLIKNKKLIEEKI